MTQDDELAALRAENARLRAALQRIDDLRGVFMSEADVAECWRMVDAALGGENA